VLVSTFFSTTIAANEEVQTMTADTNEQIIREFVDSWSELNTDKLVGYFSDDGTYHNMPTQPVKGHENLKKFIAGFISNWSKTEWEIINLIAKDNIVMVERIDRTIVNGKEVNLPCFGIFEMKDGKIVEWRDYFDLATYTNALNQ
jgi:limonene-1,2-epoxide hydrolase